MSDLNYVLESITIIDSGGNISFKKYSIELLKELNNRIIFKNPQRRDSLHLVSFNDKRWIMRDETKIISFASLTPELEYELKSIFLNAIFLGRKRSYKKMKWSSMARKFNILKSFALTLINNDLKSFNDLNSVKVLKLQAIAKSFCDSSDNKQDILGIVCFTLENYNLITPETYEALLLSRPSEEIDDNKKLSSYKSNSFPIIPDHILIKTFYAIENYKKQFYKKYKIWSKYNTEEIQNIHKGIYMVKKGEYLSRREHDSLNSGNFIDVLNQFRKVVVFNTLLFTGMRKDEAKELKNTSLFENEGIFYVTSSLSKTVENKLKLSWISSQSCNKMLNLLVKINKKVALRVQAIIDTNDPRFNEEYITHLKTNLAEDKIFTFNYSLNLCKFDTLAYINKAEMNKNYSIFKIAVDKHDIDQLEFLDCNYKSTVKGSNNYMVKYEEGDYFNFSPHQFRHTFAFFMISNNLCTIREVKHQFKHLRSSMSFIYSRRGIYAELINHSKSIDETIKIKSLMGFSNSIANQQSVGGGVKFLLNALKLKDFKYNISVDPLAFNNLDQINTYLNLNKDSINFLPHGFCMNGSDCSLKSVADPLSCISCHGYVTTIKNLPFWNGLLDDISSKLSKIYQLPSDIREKYLNLITNLELKKNQLIEIINALNGKKIHVSKI
ncbi:site-specific integrase [Acinetobacter variabilis]|uniref:site-specific integrase n=1 Tax=Acinetobacter variabilis TaxID=70346 RepID=UPI0021D0D908|nr:site-specific integrase [Acinetobacter variabilis]MCU4313055.1 site-specific integrase [Acinetobacter variabilis]